MERERESGSSSRSSTDSGERRFRIGRVGRPHGLKGDFVVAEPSDRPGMFASGMSIHVGDRETRVARHGGTKERPLIAVEGVTDREAVESLRGDAITVAASQMTPLEPGEYLVDDLIGLAVVDGESEIGEVSNVMTLPANDVLEVRRGDGRMLLVPMVADVIRSLDVGARVVDIDASFLGES